MKNTSRLATILLCIATVTQAAEVKKKASTSGSTPGVPVTVPATSMTPVSDAPSAPVMHSPARGGVGFQTLPSRIGASSTALSYLYDRDPDFSVQSYFTIGSTDPFCFGIGGIFRRTFYGSGRGGFHFGGGAALGTNAALTSATTGMESKFFFDLMGVVGIHFETPSLPNFMFTMDGGPQLHIFNSNTDFSFNAFSPALGLGIHYFI